MSVAWVQLRSKHDQIRVAKVSGGASPRVSAVLTEDGVPTKLFLAAQRGGSALALAWRGTYEGDYGIFGQRIGGARARRSPQMLSSGAKRRLYQPDVAVSSSGTVTVAWTSRKGYDFKVVEAQITGSGRATPARTVAKHARTPILRSGGKNVLIAWGSDSSNFDFIARTIDDRGHLGRVTEIVKDERTYDRGVAVDGRGRGIFTWLDVDRDPIYAVTKLPSR